jgi:Protein kinase domain/zinc-ribbon domain
MFCTSCGAQAAANARFCPSCGAAIERGQVSSARDATGTDAGITLTDEAGSFEGATIAPSAPPINPTPRKIPSAATPRSPKLPSGSGGPLHSSDPIGGGRFAAGQVLAERYRIVALAGKGGMGEVYRAEDLRLGQLVAIKFLPQELSQDAAALARFHSEVRIARQVSHPNVCRVFDIGDVDGVPFLSMEYVDGEDLASVVRRIGRLSPDKAVEVARQICAGIAAAHERGVIHRDLKPANVMLDGAGKIRVMDFGLAGIAAAIHGAEVRAGTPAYMAPEQLEGREVTIKSDIYSLGLILYEILTGKRAFEAATLAELIKLREQGTLTNPSNLVKDLDPLVERVILRCLAKDPAQRPASALQVAAALPGGDPLAAALAAGETPSPEMVAASGATEGIHPKLGLALVATVILGMLIYMFMADRFRLANITPLEKPPEVLKARAQEIIQQLGYGGAASDVATGFAPEGEYLDYIEEHDKSPTRWNRLYADHPAPILYWYRQSPRDMQPVRFFASDGAGVVTPTDPFPEVAGMITVMLDMRGRLLLFRCVPPQRDPVSADSFPAPDWTPLFAAAGMEQKAFTPVKSEWNPLLFADERAAWTRAGAQTPYESERLEAAAYHGRPVYFETIFPWQKPVRDQPYEPTTHERIAAILLIVIFAATVIASVVVVRRNTRLKRGDEVGARRLGSFVLICFLLMWLLRAHHLASTGEFNLAIMALAWGLLVSSLARVLYFALEPFVRRHDPHAIIAWTRLISGKVWDPLVGRDVLIGVTYGVLLSMFEGSDNFVLPLLHKLRPQPSFGAVDTLEGVRPVLGSIFHYTWIFVLYALLVFFLIFLVRLIVRKDWAVALFIVFLGAITNTGAEYFYINFIYAALIWLSIYVMLRRFGLLALVVGLVVQNMLVVFPMTSHLSRWYASGAVAGMLVIAALACLGFYAALAGRPIFSIDALDK